MKTKKYQKTHFAVHHLANKEKTRFAINGVHVCSESMTVTATNGRSMARVQDKKITKEPIYSNEGRVLPLDMVKDGLKISPKTAPYLNLNDDGDRVSLEGQKGETAKRLPLDGNYPDVNAVMYKADKEPIATIKLAYDQVSLMMKVLKDFHCNSTNRTFDLSIYAEDKPISIHAENGSEILEGVISTATYVGEIE